MAVDTTVEEVCDRHIWGEWKIVGYTGDWFHPHIVRRHCLHCPATETDER